MCLKILRYNTIKKIFTANGSVNVDRYCNGFVIKNNGNTNINYDGEILIPEESISVGGNYGEIYEGRIDLFFVLPSPAPITPVNLAIVTQKVYVKESLL